MEKREKVLKQYNKKISSGDMNMDRLEEELGSVQRDCATYDQISHLQTLNMAHFDVERFKQSAARSRNKLLKELAQHRETEAVQLLSYYEQITQMFA